MVCIYIGIEERKNVMRRRMATILTEMVSLTALTMALSTQAAEVNSSSYLDTYDKLQEYAWSLQYPEQGPFDIWIVSNEQGGARFVSNVPQTVFGYQIRDFDNDGQVELLISGTKTESDKLYMQMYEVTNGAVTLQSEIETAMVSVVHLDSKMRILLATMQNVGSTMLTMWLC